VTRNQNIEDERPPILGSWKKLYMLVLVNLVGWLTVFYILRRIFE